MNGCSGTSDRDERTAASVRAWRVDDDLGQARADYFAWLLRDLSEAVTTHLRALDEEMVRPADHERGKRIAKVSNALDLANDRVRYFALDVDYRTDKKEARRG